MPRHDSRELLFRYTAEAIRGICQSGKVELADKIGEKAGTIAAAALKKNEATIIEWQKKKEQEEDEASRFDHLGETGDS